MTGTIASVAPADVDEGYDVILPSGSVTKVLTLGEVGYVTDKCARYLADNHFGNVSDLLDVDRMIVLETLCYRYGIFLGNGGVNYKGKPIDEPELRRTLGSYSSEIRQLKKILGVDKSSRDAERGESSVAGYLDKLRQRGREFGVHRDSQAAKIMELGMQLIAMHTYHAKCTPEERKELGITLEDLYGWVTTVFTPGLTELDEAFRRNQKMWVQEM